MGARKLSLVGVVVGLACFVFSGVASADQEQGIGLQEGDPAPEFTCQDDSGQVWNSTDHVGKWVVVYFYPADFTSGCAKQAETFRDNMNQLTEMGVEVVGISGDSVSNHQLFKQHYKLNFKLLSDEEGAVAAQFGVPVRQSGRRVTARGPDRQAITDANGEQIFLTRRVTMSRWTFVIGKDQSVAYRNTNVRPREDSDRVLEFIQEMGDK
ncbi:MAG: peroxiredoxin [Planctomycetota bacterium]|nr:peroxiredoxin [Planctomycetota bacterium]